MLRSVLLWCVLCGVVARPHKHAEAKHSHPHQLSHKPFKLEEEDEELGLTVKFANRQVGGIATEIHWQGNPQKEYNIYVGDFAEKSQWKLLEGALLLDNHPRDTAAAQVNIVKSIQLHFAQISANKHLIVCEMKSEAKSANITDNQCGSVDVKDMFDKEDWWTEGEGVQLIPFTRPSGVLLTGGEFDSDCKGSKLFRGVLHTTESTFFYPSATSFYGHTTAPHFTVHFNAERTQPIIYQHLPISVPAKALQPVEANRRCAIQIAIAAKAAQVNAMPTAQKETLKKLIGWLSQKKGIPLEAAQFFDKEVHKFMPQYWALFSGWCGHQHVPGNKHSDPGLIIGSTNSSQVFDYGLKVTHCFDKQWIKCPEPKASDVVN